jgi:hypothetical protein
MRVGPVGPLVAGLSFVLLGAAAGCSGGNAGGGEERKVRSITAAKACSGVLGNRDYSGHDAARLRVKVVPRMHNDVSGVARTLASSAGGGASVALCYLDDRTGAQRVFSIDARWSYSGGASKGEGGMADVVYSPGAYGGGELKAPGVYVRCQTDEAGAADQEMDDQITFRMFDRLGLSPSLHRQVLLDLAGKVTARLRCTNEPDFDRPQDLERDDEDEASSPDPAASTLPPQVLR